MEIYLPVYLFWKWNFKPLPISGFQYPIFCVLGFNSGQNLYFSRHSNHLLTDKKGWDTYLPQEQFEEYKRDLMILVLELNMTSRFVWLGFSDHLSSPIKPQVECSKSHDHWELAHRLLHHQESMIKHYRSSANR